MESRFSRPFHMTGLVCHYCNRAIPLLFDNLEADGQFVFECPACGEREVRQSEDIQILEVAAKPAVQQ